MDDQKPTLSVDFDGVLHLYASGWQGATIIADRPVDGAMDWLAQAVEHFDVAIYSSRSSQPGGIAAMHQWLHGQLLAWAAEKANAVDHGDAPAPETLANSIMDRVRFPETKPAAFLTIDDRAIQFDGTFEGLEPEALRTFQPWNRR